MQYTAARNLRIGRSAKGEVAANRLRVENRLLWSNMTHACAKAQGVTWDGEAESGSKLLEQFDPKRVVDKQAAARALSCFDDYVAAGCVDAAETTQPEPMPPAAARGREAARKAARQ